MDNRVGITLVNGLGDKFMDLIGFYVLCKRVNYVPHVHFDNAGYYAWGTNHYDMRLFEFKDVVFSSQHCPYYLLSPNPSSSLSPYKVYEFLKPMFPEITLEEVSRDFVAYAKDIIQPSEIIVSHLPKNLEKAHGIHLRRTDKVNNHGDIRHENLLHEFDVITEKMLEDVEIIVRGEPDAKFVIVSEDTNWKREFVNRVLHIAENKPIEIIEIDYTIDTNYDNYASVLDMFCLSRCKEILQGVKYSTFSMLASLLGTKKIRNYAKYTDSYDACLIHSWASVLEINNEQNFDIEMHKQVTAKVNNLQTNIRERFEG